MLILSLKTDNAEAEIGLYEDTKQLQYIKWTANRELAETIHKKIQEILTTGHKTLHDVEAIICFKGPGSFTGLRIGLSVANALSYGLDVPIVGADGEKWQDAAISKILKGENHKQVLPLYGSEPHITKPTK